MRIAVVGAGVAGLVAARHLSERHEVVVLEKRPIIGGRLATRRLGDAVVDSGAQFFTVRGSAFAEQVDDWLARDLAHVWCHGFEQPADGYPRYVGSHGMAALAGDLADGLDVRPGQMVFTLRRPRRGRGWEVVIDDGGTLVADRLVLTCPVAQAWSLLAQSDVELPDDLAHRDYHRTIALLVALDRPGAVPAPGAVQLEPSATAHTFGFIADSVAKGISPVPAMTFHATQPWSADHWDDSAADLQTTLVDLAAPWLGDARVEAAQVAKWRFAGPVTTWPEPFWRDSSDTVALAGDLFAGPKVEGAFDSGLAVARAFSQG